MRTYLKSAALVVAVAFNASANPVKIKVVGPDNAPIVGAQIVLNDYAGRVDLVKKTDDKGRFATELKPIADGQLGDIVVYARGYGIARADLHTGENVLKLGREKFMTGVVRDAIGQSVSNARVRIAFVSMPLGKEDTLSYGMPEQLSEVFTTRTNLNGTWKIGGLSERGSAYPVLDDEKYIYQMVEASVKAGPTSNAPVLKAQPGASIAGRVLDKARKPVKGVTVFTTRLDEPINTMSRSESVSDAQGVYRIVSLAPGAHTVAVDTAKLEQIATARKVTATAGQTLQNQDFALTKASFIEGIVTAKETGAPMVGLRVEVHGADRPESAVYGNETATDAKGHYRLKTAPGQSRIYVSGDSLHYNRNLDVAVAKEATQTLNIALSKGVSLAGTTVDIKGKPLGGVFLLIQVTGAVYGPNHNASPPKGVTSDAKGRWKVVGLAPGDALIFTSAEWTTVPYRDVKYRFALPHTAPVKVMVRATGFKE